jgi:hypothetical protein
MRKIVFAIIGLVCVTIASGAIAGTGSGRVEIEHVGGYGNIVFFFTDTHTDMPACNTYRQRWVLSLSAPGGKEQYALLLAAQAAAKPVQVKGSGACNLWSDSENVFTVGFPVTHP